MDIKEGAVAYRYDVNIMVFLPTGQNTIKELSLAKGADE